MQAILLGFSIAFAISAILILRHVIRRRRQQDRETEPEMQDDFTLAMRFWAELEGNR